jgi:hypothetical protein
VPLENSINRLLKKAQRQGARKIDERRRTLSVRWSETIERNEAYEAFQQPVSEPWEICPSTPVGQRKIRDDES